MPTSLLLNGLIELEINIGRSLWGRFGFAPKSIHKGFANCWNLSTYTQTHTLSLGINWGRCEVGGRQGAGQGCAGGRREKCQLGMTEGAGLEFVAQCSHQVDPIQHHTWRPWPPWRSESWSSLTTIVIIVVEGHHCDDDGSSEASRASEIFIRNELWIMDFVWRSHTWMNIAVCLMILHDNRKVCQDENDYVWQSHHERMAKWPLTR